MCLCGYTYKTTKRILTTKNTKNDKKMTIEKIVLKPFVNFVPFVVIHISLQKAQKLI